jgi:SAM-dependent methyltransferase
MPPEVDYFVNHRLKLRFPWRLYHAPIVSALERALRLSPGPSVLNLGSGPFFELQQLRDSGRRFTVCDVDPRAVELARQRYGERLAGADLLEPGGSLPYADQSFDAVVSMDVIEHVPEPLPWAREALRVLKPGGLLFLTTPNYGSRSLRLIENTALEAVARLQGFSRKHLHPSKMDEARLGRVLDDAGVQASSIERIAFAWVLAAYGRKA